VEVGPRSYDGLNRCVIGILTDVHCAATERAVQDLRAKGIPTSKALGERLAVTLCPFGDGRASERITNVLRSFLL
jgi:UDP-N-acetylglucosamine 2-epimerase